MSQKITIKHRITGAVLWQSELLTVKGAVREAVDKNANLRHADLRHADLGHANLGNADLRHADLGNADLGYANLRHADLGNANLRHADLRHADLGNADLGYANLRHADLRYANLRYANLRHADLGNAIGNNREVKTIQTGKYVVNIIGDIMQIGCERHTVAEWFAFADDEIDDMDDGALEWWSAWKPILKQIIDATSVAQ